MSLHEVNAYERRDTARINLAHHIDLLTGSDHSSAFRSLLTTYGSGYDYYLPSGSTLKLPLQLTSLAGGTGIPNMPSHSKLSGGGRDSKILITGWDAVSNSSSYAGLEVSGAGITDVHFSDISIIGDWSPPVTWTNYQPAAIWVYTSDSANPQRNIQFHRCVFSTHKGFPLHAGGYCDHFVVKDCEFYDSGNGLNGAPYYADIEGNYFKNCEAIEWGHQFAKIRFNTIVNALSTAISVGGYAGVAYKPGHGVIGNQIFSPSSHGIILAEASGDQFIAFNYIEKAGGNGIQTTPTEGTEDGHIIIGNHIINAASIGLYIDSNHVRIIGNRCYNRADIGSPIMATAVNIRGDYSIIGDGNYFSGSTVAITYTTALHSMISKANRLDAGSSGKVTLNGTCSFDDASGLGGDVRSLLGGNPPALNLTDETIFYDSNSANRTISVPSAVGLKGKIYRIIKADSGAFTVTLDPNSTETIDGQTTAILRYQNDSISIISDDANWHSVSLGGKPILTATAALDYPNIAANTCDDTKTITVTGAATGDAVELGPPAGLEAGLAATGIVTAADTVTIRLCNVTVAGINPASATWRATVRKA